MLRRSTPRNDGWTSNSVLRLILTVLFAMFMILMARAQAATDVDWSNAQSVSLVMVDDRFIPDRLSFRHGVPYKLHLENHGKDLHEFTAPEFLADTVVRDPDLLANDGKEVVLQPGLAMDLYLLPLRSGAFRLICADHDWDGMMGEIVVE